MWQKKSERLIAAAARILAVCVARLTPVGPPIFLAGVIGFLLATIATILLRY
jgi:hypothetical protein